MTEPTPWLRNVWRLAAPARSVRPGALIAKRISGEDIVLGRTKSGAAFALRNACPHRGAPLAQGRLHESAHEGATLACPYHGWRFRITDGQCALIPALSETQPFRTDAIRTRSHPVHEANGLVWVFIGDEAASEPPSLGLPDAFRPRTITQVRAAGPHDEAVIGLIDPAHTPFVHRQWWWREGRPLQEKRKRFEPTALGFCMPAHAPSSNSRIYGFLGGAPTTEIEFRLPGLRIETVRFGRRRVVGVTAITPSGPYENELTHVLFWDAPTLTALTPVLQRMADAFLAQDGAILDAQAASLRDGAARPLYAGDPDAPAQWYYALKRAWMVRGPGEPFVNPLKSADLAWRT